MNSVSDHFMISKVFQVFFSKSQFFHCFDTYTSQVRKAKSAKNHFFVLFYSAKSIWDHFTISKLFKFFFQKVNFLTVSCFDPILHRWEKSLFSALSKCKIRFRSFYDFNTFSSFFFEKSIFLLFRPLCWKGEKREVREKSFLMLFYSEKFNWEHFTISNFSSFFSKSQFFNCFVFRPYTAQGRKITF